MMNTIVEKTLDLDDESFDMDDVVDETQIDQQKVIYAEARFNSGGVSEVKFHSRDILAEAKLYMDLVLPSEKEGEKFCITWFDNGSPRQKFFASKDALSKYLIEFDKQGNEVFIAQGRFKKGVGDDGASKWNREGENVTARRSLVIDLDTRNPNKAKEINKYESKEESKAAFKQFKNKTGLPKPSLIVDSGNGFHIYWAFDEDVAADDWKQLADNLKALYKECGFLVDDQVTADKARLLRMPGTHNRKDTNPAPLPVKIIEGTKGVYSFEYLEQVIDSALDNVKGVDLSNPSTKPNNLRDCHDSFLWNQPDYITNRKNLRHDVIDQSNAETQENIERVRSALASLNPDNPDDPDGSYVFWRNCIWAVASLGWNCGLDLVDEWSKRGAEYKDATRQGNSGRGAVKEIYDQYKPEKETGLGTLIQAAKEAGWQDPRSTRSADSFDLPDGDSEGGDDLSLINQIIPKIPKGCIVKPVFMGKKLGAEKIQYIMEGHGDKPKIKQKSFQNAVTMLKDPKFIRLLLAKGYSYPIYNELLGDFVTNQGEHWTDADTNALRLTCEAYKGVVFAASDICSAYELVATEYMTFNPIKDYLNSLEWDGVKRVDRLFIDTFGADDDAYTREAAKCFMVAAVRRVFSPGYKFDHVPILIGTEGIYKSGFVVELGKVEFFTALDTYEDKKAVEKTQGKWIVEMPELSATKKSEVEHEKAFITTTSVKVRLSYDRRAKEFKRQFVLVATTNETEFLKSQTGNRRWWPIVCNNKIADFEAFKASVDMLWAEAVYLHQNGASTVLSDEAEGISRTKTKQQEVVDDWMSLIWGYLEELEKEDITLTSVNDICENCLGIEPKYRNTMTRKRVRDILGKQKRWGNTGKTMRIPGLRNAPDRAWALKYSRKT